MHLIMIAVIILGVSRRVRHAFNFAIRRTLLISLALQVKKMIIKGLRVLLYFTKRKCMLDEIICLT